jgi:outer membrane protein W
MRKTIVVAGSLMFVVASAFGQEARHSNAVSIFATDMSIGNSGANGAKFDAAYGSPKVDTAYGASFDRMFSDRLSAEVSVTSQNSRRIVRTFTSGSQPSYGIASIRLYPIDATISYHFLTNNRWKPYIGAGLRYVKDTFHGPGMMYEYYDTVRTVDPEVSGGLVFQFNPTLGLRFDAKQVLGSDRSTVADPEFKVSAGLSLRF